ncbi:tRNA (adenosine(37)-N6)-threonylcarbamoyltransferase complex ATPase subunit type 1 TsaE [Carboxydothermus pertinax]|nr:tRNA (adenosine(37)-N6)-threonylcarbamoyltransferase complex ATPase subunit type 1 TsaE [Carboxydothermus pertinax]
MFYVLSDSPEKTKELGKFLGQNLLPGSIVILAGNLGAGKTLLVSGIIAGLGVKRAVKSPTFNLVHTYPAEKFNINHFDLYRLTAAEFFELGMDEYFTDRDINLLEWGEKIEPELENDYLKITLENIADEVRGIKIEAYGERFNDLLEALKRWS